MLTLNDGRSELWQWDTGRTLAVDADCSQVHFSNKVFGRSIDVDVVDGVATIPDILLQTDKDLNVWAFVGTAENGYTKISKTFKVNRRNKPADYVFTTTDQMTLQTIQSQIGDLADLTTEAKDTLVAAINEAARTGGGAGSMDLRVADGYVQYSADGGMTWTNLIAMADLKGDPGTEGKDGHSPVVTATKSGKTTTISVDGAAIATVEDGSDGVPGSRGADGITPTIGANGNWYLGEEDTGKPSRGAIGAPGKDGNPGAPGKDGAGMDITGATVGQIAKITAVDASGVPTAWSPADMPSGGSPDAVLYTAQALAYAQKKQARENIEAAGSVWPTITGPVALCPDNITDSVNAVQVTTTKDSDTDFTVTLGGLAGRTYVRVDGIRTPTYDDIFSAANVEFVLHAAYITVENSQVTDYDFSEINEEYERGTFNIWLETEGPEIRLASGNLLSNGALKLIFIGSSDGAGIEVHSVTVSESTAEYAVTSMANGNEVSY